MEKVPSEIVDTGCALDLAREVRSRRERHLKEGSQLHSGSEVRGELDGIIAQFDEP